MKKDPTVLISLTVFAIAYILSLVWEMPHKIISDTPMRFRILLLIMFVCAIRGSILWFQTLIHAVKHQPAHSRVGWVFGHVLLGFIASYYYYFTIPGPRRPRHQKTGEE